MGCSRDGRGEFSSFFRATIWNLEFNLHLIQTNRPASLRLTERCADTLISVREEIADAGFTVAEELHGPIAKLNECGRSIT